MSNIRTLIASVAALLVSMGLLLMGNGLQTLLLPLRAEMEGFSSYSIGVMGSAYFMGFVAGCLLVPRIVQQSGHIRTFAAMVSLASAAALGHVLFFHPLAWWILRAITGFCLAGSFLVIESWLNETTTNTTRGTVMSAYSVVNLMAILVGQMLLPLFDPTAFTLFALASIIVSLAAVPIVLTRKTQPAPINVPKLQLKKMYELSPAGVMGAFIIGITNGAFWSLGAVYATGSQLSLQETALFMSFPVLFGAVGQWIAGQLSDRIDRRLVLSILCIGAGTMGLLLGILPHVLSLTHLELFGLGALFGFFALPCYAIAAAHTFDHTPAGAFVETSAGILLINGIGSIIGPFGAATLMSTFGAMHLFIFTAMGHFILLSFLIGRTFIQPALEEEAKTDFATASPSASSTTVPLPTAAISEEAMEEAAYEDAAAGVLG